MKIAFVYFTNTDITGQLIAAALGEVEKEGVNSISHKISGKEIIDGRFINEHLMKSLEACNAIIFGSPTYMGSVSAQFKAFADATSVFWSGQAWAGKVAAGITSGTAPNGDQASTLQYFSILASQHGMIWTGLDASVTDRNKGVNRLGCHLGVTASSPDGSVHRDDLETARYLARRVMQITRKLAI
ncbi:flavodoxin family protein [Microbulbifer sp. TYP-18]|uniref:flavodoxin family protein n=1 Tax=Microbulbifer sp. TYP-18 TaxID=3230024 RepID=UPI0034C5B6C8